MPTAHEPIKIDQVLGLWDRYEVVVPPLGYCAECQDVMFRIPRMTQFPAKVYSRPPYDSDIAWPSNVMGDGGPVRFHKYRKITDAQDNWIVLSAANKFYDTGSGTPNTAILTLGVAASDFSLITIGQRCIFSPHDRTQGTSGEFTYIYERGVTSTARKLCGAKPTGVFTVAVSATNGNTEPGLHILALSFEFNTGFITKPALYQQLNAPAGVRKAIDLTAIPTGGAGVVARRILMSRTQKNFDGNNENPELFFALKINDNVTVVLANAISLFDSQLIQSADYLKDNLEEMPAMLCFGYFESSLVCAGAASGKSIVRVSKGGDYETFDATDGFINCAPLEGFGSGVRNLQPADGLLYMFKQEATFSSRNNGQSPNTWPVDLVDSSRGAEVFSVAQVRNSQINSINDAFLIGNTQGLWYFKAGFEDNLAWVIQSGWERDVNEGNIDRMQIVFDTKFNIGLIYNHKTGSVDWNLRFFDLDAGFSRQGVKWSIWNQFGPGSSTNFSGMAVGLKTSDGHPIFALAAHNQNNLRRIDMTNVIYSTLANDTDHNRQCIISFFLEDDLMNVLHVAMVYMRLAHNIGLGNVTTEQTLAWDIRTDIGSGSDSKIVNGDTRYQKFKTNLKDRVFSFRLSTNVPADRKDPQMMMFDRMILYVKKLWEDTAQ